MAELDSGKPVSLEELMVSNSRDDGRARQATDREGRHHGPGVQAEAAGGACGVSADSESDNTIIPDYCYVTPAKAHPLRTRV